MMDCSWCEEPIPGDERTPKLSWRGHRVCSVKCLIYIRPRFVTENKAL